MKFQISIVAALCLLPVFASAEVNDYDVWSLDKYMGDTYTAADGSFQTYAVPDGYNLGGTIPPKFNVSVNDEAYLGLYEDVNYYGGQFVFGYFDMQDGAEVTVKIACRRKFESFEIYPKNLAISDVSHVGKSITFKMLKPNQNMTLILDNEYQHTEVLHLFCNPIEEGPAVANPEKGAYYDKETKTYYYGPGYHEVPDGITVSGVRSLYIAPGAVVRSRVDVNNLTTGRIYGHGILVEDKSISGIMLCNSGNTGGTIEGIICNKRQDGWHTTYDRCSNMTIKNLKIISGYYKSNDGIDMNYCQNMTFDNVFIRANDDCVAIKGLAPEGSSSASMPGHKGLHFTRLQMWSDSNNAFGIGAETVASGFEDISLTDSDVIFDWDDVYNPEKLFYQSSLNICAMQGSYFHNILYDNVRLHHSDRAIGISYVDNFYFGSIVTKHTDPGDIFDVTYRNIVSYADTHKSNSNEVRFEAWYGDDGTPRKSIHDITFDNVVLNGVKLESFDDPRVVHNNREGDELIYDIKFIDTSAGVDKVAEPKAEAVRIDGGRLVMPEGTDRWEIYNMAGMGVMSGMGCDADVTALAAGIYVVKVVSGESIVTSKLKI